MFRFAPIKDSRFPLDERKSVRLAVDNFDSQSFNKNEAGWVRNTISELARCTSKSQYDAVAARLVEMANKGDVNPDMTIEETFAMIKPRYAQSSTEINQYLEATNSLVITQMQKAYDKANPYRKENVTKAPDQSNAPDVSAAPAKE